MPLNRNRIWSAEEDRRLLEMQASGRSFMSIAATLKRSQAAVEGRLYVLQKRAAVDTGQFLRRWAIGLWKSIMPEAATSLPQWSLTAFGSCRSQSSKIGVKSS
jgi:hypothetical protein